jgi:putative transposase
VYRVCCELKMNLRRKGKKRLPNRDPRPLCVPDQANISWSADFVSDALYGGGRFRTFNLVDDFNREALEIEVDLNLPAPRIIRVLDRIAAWRGYPQFASGWTTARKWSVWPWRAGPKSMEWTLDFIEPGKPTQNSFIERFNRTYREEVLDLYKFNSLSEVNKLSPRTG